MDKDVDVLRQELHDHIRLCQQKFEEGNAQFHALLECSQNNAKLIKQNSESTQEMVDLYRDMKGAVRLAVLMQRLGIWIIKWPLIGTGLYAIYKWVASLPTTGS